jgi:hypothetical protein
MHMKNAIVWVTMGLIAGCGGAPPAATAPTASSPAAEQFGPGLVAHDGAVDEMLEEARKVLSGYHPIAASDAPGMVTTEWAVHSAYRWPGAETRMIAEVTADRVIVRIECRTQRDTCARTVPESVELAQLPQRIAEAIALAGGADKILAKMQFFKDEVCACADASCVEDVEKAMMEWAMKNMDLMTDMKPTKAQDEEADRIQDAMEACKDKLRPAEPDEPDEPDVDAEPLTPVPAGGTGSKACDQYLATFDSVVVKCKKQLGPAYDAMVQSRNAQLEAFAQWKTLDKKSRKATIEAAETGCNAATDAIRQSAISMGCAL